MPSNAEDFVLSARPVAVHINTPLRLPVDGYIPRGRGALATTDRAAQGNGGAPLQLAMDGTSVGWIQVLFRLKSHLLQMEAEAVLAQFGSQGFQIQFGGIRVALDC